MGNQKTKPAFDAETAQKMAERMRSRLNRSLPSCLLKPRIYKLSEGKGMHVTVVRGLYGMYGAGVYNGKPQPAGVHWIAEVSSARDNPQPFEGTKIIALPCYKEGLYYAPSNTGDEPTASPETLIAHNCFDRSKPVSEPDKIDTRYTGSKVYYAGGLSTGGENPKVIEYLSVPHEKTSFMKFVATVQRAFGKDDRDFNLEMVLGGFAHFTSEETFYYDAGFLDGKTLVLEDSDPEIIEARNENEKDKPYWWLYCVSVLDGQSTETQEDETLSETDMVAYAELSELLKGAGVLTFDNGRIVEVIKGVENVETKKTLTLLYRHLSDTQKQGLFS